MWVKICGITNEEDALMAVALGADAIGFVFAPSPRQVSVGVARDITRRLPPEVEPIGAFRDQDPQFISNAVLEAGLRGVQLHGHETPQLASEITPRPRRLIVAFAAGSPGIERFEEYRADAMLLDAQVPGSGKVFDWDLVDGVPDGARLILAGGLTADNVAAAVERVRPWGVDVSTGVEASPGQKDPVLVSEFIAAVRAAAPAASEVDDPGADPDGAASTSAPFDWYDDSDL